jgi:tRNA(Ile)-lysidine synthase
VSARVSSAAVLAVRSAVDDALSDAPTGAAVVVGCSGGPDSLALVGGLGWVAPRRGLQPIAVVVDHGLQPGSGQVATDAAAACERLGVPARIAAVRVGSIGGPEAAARTARREALEQAADEVGAVSILLGHTQEDQAETVLLRLARGSGARSLAAMAPRTGRWVRPLLALPREQVRAAAEELLAPLGVHPWSDPHNADPAYARVRVRGLLDDLVTAIGPGAVRGLARSAELLRADADALDAMADDAYAALVRNEGDGEVADCAALAALTAALRTRVIRRMCLRAGSAGDVLDADHVRQVDALVVAWRGQGPVALPGAVEASRACGRLCARPSRPRPGVPSGA